MMRELIYLAPILFVGAIAGLMAAHHIHKWQKAHRRMIDSGQYRGADRD